MRQTRFLDRLTRNLSSGTATSRRPRGRRFLNVPERQTATDFYEKKVSKSPSLITDDLIGSIESIVLGTYSLPKPIPSAVKGSAGWGVPRTLREDLAIRLLTLESSTDEEMARFLESRRNSSAPDEVANRPTPILSPEEWQNRAHAKGKEATEESRNHRLLGLWLKDLHRIWPELRNSLKKAIEAFAGHRGDARRKVFDLT